MLDRVAPRNTDRFLLLSLAKSALRDPALLRRRLDRRNLRDWARFQRLTCRCPVCGHQGRSFFYLGDLAAHERLHIGVMREAVRCRGCGALMRARAMAVALLEHARERYGVDAADLPALRDRLPAEVRILDTDADGVIATALRGHPGLVRSLYFADRPPGAVVRDGVVNVDLEQMPFDDASLDVVLSSEVLEHVRHVDVVHREVARCLRPGGAHVFTVPYDERLEKTWELVDVETGRLLVEPPHWHGDPLAPDGRILSYRVFGRDLADRLAEAGLVGECRVVDRPELGVYGGDVVVASKSKAAVGRVT